MYIDVGAGQVRNVNPGSTQPVAVAVAWMMGGTGMGDLKVSVKLGLPPRLFKVITRAIGGRGGFRNLLEFM